MHLVRKTRRITMLVGAGAVAAYFLDPDNGAARREHLLDQIRELTQRNDLFGAAGGGEAFTAPSGVDDETSASLPPLDEPINPPSGDDTSPGASEGPEPHLVAEALSGQHSEMI